MSQEIDFERIRRNAWAKGSAPEWPKGVRAISMDGLTLFGLDEKYRLYWDGRPVEMRQTLRLTFWQRLATITTVVAAVIAAISVAATAWIEVSTFLNPPQ